MKTFRDMLEEGKTYELYGNVYKLVKKGSRLHLINTKNSSDTYIFKNKKEMDEFLADYTPRKGGTQSSHF